MYGGEWGEEGGKQSKNTDYFNYVIKIIQIKGIT